MNRAKTNLSVYLDFMRLIAFYPYEPAKDWIERAKQLEEDIHG